MTDSVSDAAYDYVESVVDKADTVIEGAPAWYGWALREAFAAGAAYALTKEQQNA
jgi:hypothetical protein